MGRGITSGLIQIRSGQAQNMTLSVQRPGSNEGNSEKEIHAGVGGSINCALCRESSLRKKRDADDGRT
jgi:hypothetical protein